MIAHTRRYRVATLTAPFSQVDPMDGEQCKQCRASRLVPQAVRGRRPRFVACGHALVWSSYLSLVLAAVAFAVLYSARRFPDDLRDEMKGVDMPGEVQAAFIDGTSVGSKEYSGLTPAQKEVFNKCLHHRAVNSPDLRFILLGLAAALLGGYAAIAFPLGWLLRRRKPVAVCARCGAIAVDTAGTAPTRPAVGRAGDATERDSVPPDRTPEPPAPPPA